MADKAAVVHPRWVNFQPTGWVIFIPTLTLIVHPLGDDPEWLTGASAGFETLRRHLEETCKAILDGVAVLELCNEPLRPAALIAPVRPPDACNSELVLLRQDDELDDGYEIARGDELNCWSEFELACERKDLEVTRDGNAWRAGAGRYVWQLSTLRPVEIIPGLVLRELGETESAALFHRYKLAKRVFGGPLCHRQTKPLDYLGTLEDKCRVNLHRVLLELKKAGHTWETYCAEIGGEQQMEAKLPIGFMFQMMEYLKLPDPNVILARPNRAELAPVDDDTLLRALMPRVDHVMYRLPSGVDHAVQDVVREAIGDFAGSMQVWKMTAAGAFQKTGEPFPYLVYANDGEELRSRLADQGLRMYAGVMLHLFSTANLAKGLALSNAWPFAIGHSLYLDIDVAGTAP